MSFDLTSALRNIDKADAAQLEQLRVEYLGRHGTLTKQLRAVGDLPAQERAEAGSTANKIRIEVEQAIEAAQTRLNRAELEREVAEITLDVSAPVKQASLSGHYHPSLQVIDDIVKIFWQMGYTVADGPEIDQEWYNFDALLVEPDHPARDMQDTFYLEGGNLPRTHTSNVQIRYMQNHQPPIRIIAPGKAYRNEDEDSRHGWMFNQVEGLVVDKGVSLSDLKGTLLAMMQGLLGAEVQVKLLPNYFPYTEPSVEMHATCPVCRGEGCHTCSGTGWLELGGAGMVHPKVLQNVGIDPEIYTGFAFGFGPDRIAMIRHNLTDVRDLWRPNLRFLEQFE